jgi:protein gp37
MSETTAIEWCDATWSPWEGCTKVSPGCDHCYAEAMNRWLRKAENWGPGAPRRRYSDAHWQKPLRWNEKAKEGGLRMRVFPSVCDPFDNEVDPAWRAKFFALIGCTPWLAWLLLTKRIGNASKMLAAPGMPKTLPPNVRIGATMVNQEEWDRDISKLLELGCPNFVSLEPLLGPIDMRMGGASVPDYAPHRPLPRLDWVIVGGESGHGARPMHPEWARSLRDQCAAAGVPFHFKQWGEWTHAENVADDDERELAEGWVALDGTSTDGRMVDFFGGDEVLYRVGKKAAGRLLDGVTHDGFPEVRR